MEFQPTDFYKVHTKPVFKFDEDRTKFERQITKINIDVKFLNKILANRIHHHIKKITSGSNIVYIRSK